MNNQYRNNTNLNLADLHAAHAASSAALKYKRSTWNIGFIDEEQEALLMKERAETLTVLMREQRVNALMKIKDTLEQLTTCEVFITNLAMLKNHIERFEEDKFEQSIKTLLANKRIDILNYTYSLICAIFEFNHTPVTVLKLIKRLAIRLGLSSYAQHL